MSEELQTTPAPAAGIETVLSSVPTSGFTAEPKPTTTEVTTTEVTDKAETPDKTETTTDKAEKLLAGKFKSVEDLEKGYLEANKAISRGGDKPPENYELAELEKFNLGFRDDQHRDDTLTALKAAGMSQKTLNAVAPVLAQAFEQHDAARDAVILGGIEKVFGVVPNQAYFDKQMESLRSEWGDEFDSKSKVANAILPELPERIRAVAAWDAEVFKFIYHLAVQQRGPEILKDTSAGDGVNPRAEMERLVLDSEYWVNSARGEQLRAKVTKLSKQLHKN